MMPEDLDAVIERWVPTSPADVGTVDIWAPVDRKVLARLRGLQGEVETNFLAELASVFPEDARSGPQEIEEALQRGDAPAVERVAHKLKGGSGSMAQGDVRPLRAVGRRRRIRRSLARLRTTRTRTNQGGIGAARAGARGRDIRFQVKWFQPDNPSTGSSPRLKTTADWVISPISVRGTSTLFASVSRTGPGAQTRSS